MVITEDITSLRLLTASSMIAIEELSMPTTALNDARNTFARIPIRLVLTMTLSLFIEDSLLDKNEFDVLQKYDDTNKGIPKGLCSFGQVKGDSPQGGEMSQRDRGDGPD